MSARPGSSSPPRSPSAPDGRLPPEQAQSTERSVAEPDTADQRVDGDRAVSARVHRTAGTRGQQVGIRRVGQEPGLVGREAEMALVEVDPVVGAGGNPLDREDIRVRLAEDDDRIAGDVAVLLVGAITKNRNRRASLLTVIPVGSRPVSAAVRAV